MFYVLSKIIWFLIQPTSFMIFLGCVGVILLWSKWQALSKWLLTTSLLSLFIMGVSPVSNILLIPLEERFSRPDLSKLKEEIKGIIVLGGTADAYMLKKRNLLALNESAERFTEAVILAKKIPNAKLVFTGGAGALSGARIPEAISAEYYFKQMGIDPNRIILEDKSRNTIENALFTKQLINPQKGEKWILVTSAFHMTRSMGCFRTAGIPVIPWPVDYRTRGVNDAKTFFNILSEGLRRTDLATKEWIGLLAYWLTGRIPNLFPSPE